MIPALVVALVVGVGAVWRTLTARRVEGAYLATHPAGESGVVSGGGISSGPHAKGPEA